MTPAGPRPEFFCVLSDMIWRLQLCYFSFGSEVPGSPVFGTSFFSPARCTFWCGSFVLWRTLGNAQMPRTITFTKEGDEAHKTSTVAKNLPCNKLPTGS